MYPIFIVIVVIGVVAVMMVVIVPKLLDIFDDKSALPASTKALIAISDGFRSYWLFFIIIIVGVYFFIQFWRKTPD